MSAYFLNLKWKQVKLLYFAFTTINNRLDVYNIKVDNKLVVKLLFEIKVLLTLLKKLRFWR